MKKLLAVLVGAVLAVGVTASAAWAHPTPEPDCDGETYAVVSAPGDMAMAELVASWQVLDTDCVVAPGEAESLASASQQTVVLGGTAAVPASAVDGLNVIERLWGRDRVATAEAVLAWIDRRANAHLATTAKVDAAPGAKTFEVGKDIRAGLWRFARSSGQFPDSDISHPGYAGLGCHAEAEEANTFRRGVSIVRDGSETATNVGPYGGTLIVNEPFDTFVFLLNDGDTVTLRVLHASRICEIERSGTFSLLD